MSKLNRTYLRGKHQSGTGITPFVLFEHSKHFLLSPIHPIARFLTHTHTHTPVDGLGTTGVSILAKDTLTHVVEEQGINLPTF